MTERPVILSFVRYYLPGYKAGGPVRSISNIVNALSDEFEFRIVTYDHDILDSSPYTGIKAGSWNRVGKAWVYYVPRNRARLRDWIKLINETPHSALYLNSLFDPKFTFLPLFAKWLRRISKNTPTIVAARGELSPGALAIKRWKKRLYLVVTSKVGLYRNVVWHASTEDEARLIRNQFGGSSTVEVACNLPTVSEKTDHLVVRRESDRSLHLVFLSRLSKMKNLDFALKVLGASTIDIKFDIWGTQEDEEYWNVCQRLISKMPDNVIVQYCGIADYSKVSEILAQYDLFFLPTHGENYGHVIAESLVVGTPVLISDQTPWQDLDSHGVGWAIPLAKEDEFVGAIKSAAERTAIDRENWRIQVAKYANLRLNDPLLVSANRDVFRQAIGEGFNNNLALKS